MERRPIAIANARQSMKNQVKLRHLKVALRNSEPSNSSEWTIWRKELDDALQENSEHFDSINLQIGYVYGAQEFTDGPCSHYIPYGGPGARLPHSWISTANTSRTISTLDLIDGLSFVLLISPDCPNSLSRDLVSSRLSVYVRAMRIGTDLFLLDASWLDVVGLSTPGSALLVRPDQHIVGNVKSVEDLERLLRDTLKV